MYITRDEQKSQWSDKEICLWKDNDTFEIEDNIWATGDSNAPPFLQLTCEQFKQLFSKQKLPKKGSCKYVELKLYIP